MLPAQVPQGIKYQAAVRDNQGNLLIDSEISIRFSILSGSPDGNVEYQEFHHVFTNKFGLVNLIIGQGNTLTGDFDGISWNKGMFLKIEVDVNNSGNFIELGTSEILSVPYAFNSQQSETSTYADTAYFAFNESSPGDRQIRFEFGPSNTYGITTTNGQFLDKPSQTIIKFNKNNYNNVKSIVFGASMYTSNSSGNCLVELWDLTNNVKITNAALSTSSTTEIYVETENILDYLPDQEITLAIKIASGTEDVGAWVSKAYLFINKSENVFMGTPIRTLR